MFFNYIKAVMKNCCKTFWDIYSDIIIYFCSFNNIQFSEINEKVFFDHQSDIIQETLRNLLGNFKFLYYFRHPVILFFEIFWDKIALNLCIFCSIYFSSGIWQYWYMKNTFNWSRTNNWIGFLFSFSEYQALCFKYNEILFDSQWYNKIILG